MVHTKTGKSKCHVKCLLNRIFFPSCSHSCKKLVGGINSVWLFSPLDTSAAGWRQRSTPQMAKAGGIPFVTSAYVRVLEFASSLSLL